MIKNIIIQKFRDNLLKLLQPNYLVAIFEAG